VDLFGILKLSVWLDIHRMTGNINEQMAQNIVESNTVFLIGTPRYLERSTVETNVAKECNAIQAKLAQTDNDFHVFPLIYNGSVETSLPGFLRASEDVVPLQTWSSDPAALADALLRPATGLLFKYFVANIRNSVEELTSWYQEFFTSHFDPFLARKEVITKHMLARHCLSDLQSYDVFQRLDGYIDPTGLVSEEQPVETRFDLKARLPEFLEDQKTKTFVVQGRAGSGKSLFGLYIFRYYLEEWMDNEEEETDEGHNNDNLVKPKWLPVYMQLRNLKGVSDLEKCVETHLQENCELNDDDLSLMKNEKNNVRLVVICDGLDEVGAGLYPNLAEQLRDWPLAKLIVTSRPEHFTNTKTARETFYLRDEDGLPIY